MKSLNNMKITSKGAHAVYVCYFGLREPLVQSQVIPYIKALAADGHDIKLLTFEPEWPKAWSRHDFEYNRNQLYKGGIVWIPLAYHKRPSLIATLYDIISGVIFIIKTHLSTPIDIIHARSHVPMTIALVVRVFIKAMTIFDFRGFLADEYVDAGVWRINSPVYIVMKWIESLGFRLADHIIVLTEAMKSWLIEKQEIHSEKISIIPCCVDLTKAQSDSLKQPVSGIKLAYAGALNGLYLLSEMAAFFSAFRQIDESARLTIFTNSDHQTVKKVLSENNIEQHTFTVSSVQPELVLMNLAEASAGLSFRKPAFAQIAASPTKIPEYLGAGLPVVSNAGIGDTDDILQREMVGVVVQQLTEDGYHQAISQLLELMTTRELSERCRSVAHKYFDLDTIGGPRYCAVYRHLMENSSNH